MERTQGPSPPSDHQRGDASICSTSLEQADSAGADAADAVFADRRALSVSYRLGNPENLERSEGKVIGLRIFVGTAAGDRLLRRCLAGALTAMVERGLAMARAVPEDPYCGLADASEVVRERRRCRRLRCARDRRRERHRTDGGGGGGGLAVSGVTNSEGAEAGAGVDTYAIAASNGLRHGLFAVVAQHLGIGSRRRGHGDGAGLRIRQLGPSRGS